jgi:hypothetical protein
MVTFKSKTVFKTMVDSKTMAENKTMVGSEPETDSKTMVHVQAANETILAAYHQTMVHCAAFRDLWAAMSHRSATLLLGRGKIL